MGDNNLANKSFGNGRLSQNAAGNLYVLTAAVLWSLGGVLLKNIPWNPIITSGFRAAVALVFYAAVIKRGFRLKLNRYTIGGGVAFALTTSLFVAANTFTTAANAIVLQYTAPIYVLIADCIIKKRPPLLKQLIIVIVAFGGMALFFLDQLQGGALVGNLLAIASGVCFAALAIINSRPGASPDDTNMIGFSLNILFFICMSPFLNVTSIEVDAKIIISILALGIVQIGIPYWAYGRGMQRAKLVSASLLCMLEAILNPIWVALVDGEIPGKFALLGGILILAAVAANILLVREE